MSRWGEPLFIADWRNVLMIHLEVDGDALQRLTPFEIERFDGRALVSLVAFTMGRMRPRRGGRLTEWMFRPMATHEFLNVRTYVRHGGEPGIEFLAEWLPNRWSARLGPRLFGLPYRLGHAEYDHDGLAGELAGRVRDARTGAEFSYRARFDRADAFVPCPEGSLDEWLMERYTAFTQRDGVWRLFRVWHPPWPQVSAEVTLLNTSLLEQNWPWLAGARAAGANYSPGFREVWMGRPHRLR